jgi:hypothetical protein
MGGLGWQELLVILIIILVLVVPSLALILLISLIFLRKKTARTNLEGDKAPSAAPASPTARAEEPPSSKRRFMEVITEDRDED